MGRGKVLLIGMVDSGLRQLGRVVLFGSLPVVLLQLRLRTDRSVGAGDLVGARGVVVRIVSNILFLVCEVQRDPQGRYRILLCMCRGCTKSSR